MITFEIDLDPNDFGEQSDALFHLGECYPLAHGELDGIKWSCMLSNCGEQHIHTSEKDGSLLFDNEVLEKYDTDKKLSDAINSDKVILVNNSWWELEFFRDDENNSWHLDLFTDNSEVIDSPKDAVEYLKVLMKDESFVEDFRAALNWETNKEQEGSTM